MHNNYKIVYSYRAQSSLNNFLSYMADNCIYRDSGFYPEDFFVQSFIEDNRNFVDDLKEKIEEIIHNGVFGTIEISNKKFQITKLVIFLRSYNITLHCIKWFNEEIVSIENLIIRN